MATTVLGALQCAKINFEAIGKEPAVGRHPIFVIALEQLTNAVTALENGKAPSDVIQEYMGGEVDLDA